MPERVFIALGSNMGDRSKHLSHARERLSCLPQTTLIATSTIDETEPIGPDGQSLYLNQMVLLRTDLSPRELLRHCHNIEDEAGRVRNVRWGPRTLDLDIVRFGDRVSAEDDLKLPHPELENRAFWQREVEELERSLP